MTQKALYDYGSKPDSQIRLDTDNGYGSTNTTVWRFTKQKGALSL